VVKNDANLVNARTGVTERLSHIGALSWARPSRR
jgi:hypothetical protein